MVFGFLKRIVEPIQRFVKPFVEPIKQRIVEPIKQRIVEPIKRRIPEPVKRFVKPFVKPVKWLGATWVTALVAVHAVSTAWLVVPAGLLLRRVFRDPKNSVDPRYKWNGCISCRKAPTGDTGHFCQTCHANVLHQAPILVPVPDDHQWYGIVESQFRSAWSGDGMSPDVRGIYKVVITTQSDTNYQQYRANIENEQDRWIEAARICNLGDHWGEIKFCSNTEPRCYLCSIVKLSYDFSVGLFTTEAPLRSNLHSHDGNPSGLKALLQSKVVVGNAHTVVTPPRNSNELPRGHNSATVQDRGQVIVYRGDAFLPLYLVVYDVSHL